MRFASGRICAKGRVESSKISARASQVVGRGGAKPATQRTLTLAKVHERLRAHNLLRYDIRVHSNYIATRAPEPLYTCDASLHRLF